VCVDVRLDGVPEDGVELRDAGVVHVDDAVQINGNDEVRFDVFQISDIFSLKSSEHGH
jgi:hypothetical protein